MSVFTITLYFLYSLFNLNAGTQNVNQIVQNIWGAINDSVNPCENFYEYACGNWNSRHSKPTFYPQWDTFLELQNKVFNKYLEILEEPYNEKDTTSLRVSKHLYDDCMKEESKSPDGLKKLLDKIGGWPLLNSDWNSTNFDWWELTGQTVNQFLIGVFFTIFVTPSDSTPNNFRIDSTTLFLDYAFVNQTHLEPEIIKGYQVLVKAIAKELGGLNSTTNLDKKVEDIVNFELKLSKIIRKQNETLPLAISSTIGRVQSMYSYVVSGFDVNLVGYLKAAYESDNVNVSEKDQLTIVDEVYFLKLLRLIEETPKETVANYIAWRVVAVLAPFSNKAIAKVLLDFSSLSTPVKQEILPRNLTCIYVAYSSGVEQKYMQQNFDKGSSETVRNMTKQIIAMTYEMIERAKLDRTQTIKSLIYILYIEDCIGYPNWLNDSNFLNENYLLGSLDTPNTSLMEKIVWLRLQSKELSAPKTDNCDWPFSARLLKDSFSPYYDPTLNTINLGWRFLQQPFFSMDDPISIAYGALGTILGHEIAHAIQRTGWTNDLVGNLSNIGNCLVNQYQNLLMSDLSATEIKEQNLGVKMLKENFADNFGLKSAFYTYKKFAKETTVTYSAGDHKYTDDQMFFLSFAQNYCDDSLTALLSLKQQKDTHAPDKYRVIGSLRNFPEFSIVWQCPSESFMNPISKCTVI